MKNYLLGVMAVGVALLLVFYGCEKDVPIPEREKNILLMSPQELELETGLTEEMLEPDMHIDHEGHDSLGMIIHWEHSVVVQCPWDTIPCIPSMVMPVTITSGDATTYMRSTKLMVYQIGDSVHFTFYNVDPFKDTITGEYPGYDDFEGMVHIMDSRQGDMGLLFFQDGQVEHYDYPPDRQDSLSGGVNGLRISYLCELFNPVKCPKWGCGRRNSPPRSWYNPNTHYNGVLTDFVNFPPFGSAYWLDPYLLPISFGVYIIDETFQNLESISNCMSLEEYLYFERNPHLIEKVYRYYLDHGCDAIRNHPDITGYITSLYDGTFNDDPNEELQLRYHLLSCLRELGSDVEINVIAERVREDCYTYFNEQGSLDCDCVREELCKMIGYSTRLELGLSAGEYSEYSVGCDCGGNYEQYKACVLFNVMNEDLNLEDNADCLMENVDVLFSLWELVKSGELVDACDPSKTMDEIINEILEPCPESAEDLYGNLFKNDYIILPKSVEQKCPKYYCIMNEMMNGSLGTAFVCDMLSGFNGTTGSNNGLGFQLNVVAKDFSQDSRFTNEALVLTGIVEQREGSGDYIIAMSINTLHCESTNVVEIFETIQHELIHADIKRRLIEVYGYPTTTSTEAEVFHQLVIEEYGGQAGTDEHRLMLEYYLEEMVNSLIEMNGGVGTYDDFVGAVLNGFSLEVLNYCGITLEYVQEKYSDFQDFIDQPGNINSTLASCES